ncbi:NADH-quinone oxidoreductase, chain G [Desulfovibrio sp. X2]|uniref:NADH-quinone oxidoreductase subunit NuoG n=1 Tax=Desulfovibrio sp. X2 TaxID=941449 RepID=UPI000358C405|nr:NADH-quinone oxidoreductase subunit NuoG [Desulfovibrio sp. X2]EPR43562.1 NADH-quinone oxidoreductase, chain G [Desulfovibrio sp. X2]
MPTLTIDGLTITVEPGIPVIEAAERLGIVIPRFCYHEALGPVGACRMCAVMVLEAANARQKGLQMSCMLAAADGMVVSTDHPQAMRFRSYVAEWLMMDHPHDCPVCDEGGHCHLQDTTVAAGHSRRRYRGAKRTFPDQYLGPLIQHEMNRCIHCYRCVRFYQEYAGAYDFGALRIGRNVYYGRFEEGPFESPFAGNLVDVCPTGVFTDKPSRYKARRWDLERAASLCLSCSLGCATTAGARYHQLIRLEARRSPEVNGHFICDRGRYGHEYANLPERPRRARVNGAETTVDEALNELSRRIMALRVAAGPDSMACLSSPRASLESLAVLAHLASAQGWASPAFFPHARAAEASRAAAAALAPSLAVCQNEMSKADAILAVGVDPLCEAPMLALAMRRASRGGAKVAVLDPRPVALPLPFTHLPVRRAQLDAALAALCRAALPRPEDGAWASLWDALPEVPPEDADVEAFAAAAEFLGEAKFPVVVCGTDVAGPATMAMAAAFARLLAQGRERAGLFPVLSGADAMGAAVLDRAGDGLSVEEVLDAVEAGRVRGLVVCEADPFSTFPDKARLAAALGRLDLLAVLDCLPGELADAAHVLLPTQSVFECGGSFLNQEGRLQQARRVHGPGMPLAQATGGSHPERVFTHAVAGGDARPAWELLAALGNRLATAHGSGGGAETERWAALAADPWQAVAAASPALAATAPGTRAELCDDDTPPPPPELAPADPEPEADPLADVLFVEQTFGTEELSRRSPSLAGLVPAPAARLHELDAAELHLTDGDDVVLPMDGGVVRAVLRTARSMARGTLVLPRRPEAGWHVAGADAVRVALHRIWKEHEAPAGAEAQS